jgi:hypothetical protein
MSHTLEQLRSGALAGTQRLDLACGLRSFPPEIFELADTLEVLNLSGNALSTLPDDIGRLHKLRVLFCSGNAFTHLPESIGQCPQLDMVGFKANQIAHVPAAALPLRLRWLILTDNHIAQLPAELGRCSRLQKLMLAGNRLQQLPEALAQCTKLGLLRMAANQFQALPEWLLAMPELAWLAFAGNPFNAHIEAQAMAAALAQGTRIGWPDLSVQGQLGEGASGVIHAAIWQRTQGAQAVAIKLFKGDVTSDGLPHSELAACLAAGAHPHLIGVHGVLTGHPDGREGLVMQRIDAAYRPLASPPSLASCTRDVYAPGQVFTLEGALQVALGLASACTHLHGQGILHGDLYAHNTLWRGQAPALLGDFGAASFMPSDERIRHALTRVDVRALGCLLEELLARVPNAPDTAHALSALRGLQGRCMQADVSQRPEMAEVRDQLQALANR